MEWETDGKRVWIDGDGVHVETPGNRPTVRTRSRAEAFSSPRMLFVHDMGVVEDLLVTLAGGLAPGDLEDPVARKRLAFWGAIDPGVPREASFTYVERYASYAWEVTLEVDGLVVTRVAEESMGQPTQMLLDEAFFYGPIAYGGGAEVRDGFRELVLDALPAEAGITREDVFPEVDYGALKKRSWSFYERPDGETYVIVDGHSVVAGYQYQRDMGSSRYPVERVLTGAPGVSLGAPGQVRDEVLAYLRAAVR